MDILQGWGAERTKDPETKKKGKRKGREVEQEQDEEETSPTRRSSDRLPLPPPVQSQATDTQYWQPADTPVQLLVNHDHGSPLNTYQPIISPLTQTMTTPLLTGTSSLPMPFAIPSTPEQYTNVSLNSTHSIGVQSPAYDMTGELIIGSADVRNDVIKSGLVTAQQARQLVNLWVIVSWSC
jgi:hypothetical protein